MTTERDADLLALEEVSARLAGALRSIVDDQWMLGTPCLEWDLSELVDHVTGGNWFTAWISTGLSSEEAMTRTMQQFVDGSATSAHAASSVTDQLAAFGLPGVLEQTWSHVAGDLTGRQVLRLRLHDLIVHTWDIEQSLGPPATFSETLAQWGTRELADTDSLTAEHFGLGPVLGPESFESASAAYLSRFGR